MTGISALALGVGATPVAAEQRPLVVLAAISLKGALDRLAMLWREDTKNPPLRLAYGASNALARQIEQGAPGDCFLSADLEWMAHLAARGLVKAETQVIFAANRLVIIAQTGQGDGLNLEKAGAFRAALKDGRFAVARTDTVPAGRYAREALQSLGAWEDVRKALVETEHPRAALQLVARGEARLGIVYRSDALAETGVHVLAEVPEGAHRPIRYPAAMLQTSNHPQARAFLDWLGGDQARAVFLELGMSLPGRAP